MMEIWEEEGERDSERRDGPGDEIGADSVIERIKNFPMYSPTRSLTDWLADQVQSPPLDLPATTTVCNIEASLGYEASLFGLQFEYYEAYLPPATTTMCHFEASPFGLLESESPIISQLKSLIITDTDCSRLESLIITDCSRLESLIITDCSRLESFIITDCSWLESLIITYCSWLEPLIITDCSQLEQLIITDCSQPSLIITGGSQLESLIITDCSQPSLIITDCWQLKSLIITDCWQPLLIITDCLQLESLIITDCLQLGSLTDCSQASLIITGCSQLGSLIITDCSRPSLIITGCSQLESLIFTDCSQPSLIITGCSRLESLIITDCSWPSLNITDCSQLGSLNITDCSQPSLIITDCLQLESLIITDCSQPSLIITGCSQLGSLIITDCSRPKSIITYCSQLESLSLIITDCSQPSLIITGCSQLESLIITDCSWLELIITDCSLLEWGAKNIGQKVGSAEKSCINISHSKKKNTIETPKRKYRTKRLITLDDLRLLFGRKRVDAAKTLGVSMPTFKRYCRQHGITRWNGDGCSLVEPKLLNNSVHQNSSGSKPPEVQGEKEISALLGARQDAVTIKAKYEEGKLEYLTSNSSIDKPINAQASFLFHSALYSQACKLNFVGAQATRIYLTVQCFIEKESNAQGFFLEGRYVEAYHRSDIKYFYQSIKKFMRWLDSSEEKMFGGLGVKYIEQKVESAEKSCITISHLKGKSTTERPKRKYRTAYLITLDDLRQLFGHKRADAAKTLGGCWIGAEMNHIVQFLKVEESNAQGYSLEGSCVKANNLMDEKLNLGVQYNQTFQRRPGVEIIQLDSSEERIFGELCAKNIGQNVESAEKSCIAISHSKKKNTIETPKRKYRTKRSITLDDLRPLFGQKRVEAATTLGVSVPTFKRYCRQNGITWWNGDGCSLVEPMLVNNSVQQNSSGSKPPEVQGEKEISALLGARQDAVTIKAKYGEVNLKFQLSSESSFAELQEAVAKRLKSKAFTVEYEDEDQEPILIACDEDWQACVKFFGNQVIRLAIRENISNSKKSHGSGRGLKRKRS